MSTGVYAKTAGDLIRDALRAASISGIELQVEASDFAQGEMSLNDILMNLQARQIHLWQETEAVMPLNPLQEKYVFGVDHAFTDYVYAVTTAAALLGATTLSVPTTGMTTGDNIGVELENGARHWCILTVVNSTSLTLSIALPDDAAIGATVYAYTTGIDQPVRIESVRYAESSTSDEISVANISRDTYFNQPTKSAQGAVNAWYFSRQLSQTELYVWPVAVSCNNLLRFTYIKPQYIPEDQSEDILIPPEWYPALKFKLAADLGMVYGIDANRQMMLEQKAAMYLEDAMNSDDDVSSFMFHP